MSRAISGFLGYYATDAGQIIGKLGRPLSQSWMGGYLSVNIAGTTAAVHRLVALAFVPNLEDLPFALHQDDNRTNNIPSNLYWGSHSDNMRDRTSNQHTVVGEDHGRAKLTEDAIRHIRTSDLSSRQLAQQHDVSSSVVRKARDRTTWRHVP